MFEDKVFVKELVKHNCQNCGGPLATDLQCSYCTTLHSFKHSGDGFEFHMKSEMGIQIINPICYPLEEAYSKDKNFKQ